ncbi:chlorophyll a/b-binding protein [Cyanobium sp. NIES-981]|uniref:chlorophyll a/b-binding protein n=1 Tax=Cyanobium sp. NIES-981 TaxID=1851505 RepID=UPI0007DD6E35
MKPTSAPSPSQGAGSSGDGYLYEPVERFGEGLSSERPWNTAALAAVERLNGRAAMLGFLAAVVGEELTGKGILGQLAAMVGWLLG